MAVTASDEALGGTVGWGGNDEISLAKSMICATEMEERCVDTYTVISLFSGIGGLDLGVRAAIPTRTICYVEREITCARVLAERMLEGLLDEAPIYSDVKSFPTELFAGKVDIDFLLSSFPCQPFSVAGKQKGEADERNLWPDTLRLLRALRPRYAFMENVPGLVSHPYFGTILGDLAQAGYDAEWGCFTASQVGASHKRERLFILAYRPLDRMEEPRSTTQVERSTSTGSPISSSKELAYSEHERTQVSPTRRHATEQGNGDNVEESYAGLPEFPPGPEDERWGWIIEQYPELAPALCKMHEAEPEVRNVVDAWAIKDRVAALMMLGNAVVPAQAELALRTLLERRTTWK